MSQTTLDPGERIAPANGLEICYQTFGEDTDPPLLLIMGLGAQMIVWDDEFCARLAARGYRVIRFDNRDIGRSSKIDAPPPADLAKALFERRPDERLAAPYLLRDMAADAIGLLDFLRIGRAHVVGASMGGMIAQELAIHWPQRVRTLTSIMSSTSDPSLPPPAPEVFAVFLAPPPLTPEEYVEANMRTWRAFRNGGFPEEEPRDRERAVRAAGRGLCPEGGARQMLAVVASGSRKASLPQIKAPTLVIHGADDPLVPLAAGEDTARSIPGARLVVIERMGHALPMAVWPRAIDEIAAHAK
jgi:pimeloyl-ACP methyl ester carboxylesterase